MATKRLMKEYTNIQKELDKNEEYQNILQLEPLADLFHWNSKIKGPKGSPFEKGVWEIRIDVPHDYPISPPKMKFVNKICHPNVNFKVSQPFANLLMSYILTLL